jgi:hypothetical protein
VNRRAAIGLGCASLALLAAGCRDGGGNERAFCNQVVNVPVITDRDQLAVPDPATATGNLVTALRRLRTTAPNDIRRDVTTMVTVAEAVQRALTTPGTPDAEEARTQIERQSPAWSDASARVVSYARRTCGIDLSSSPG